MMSCENNRKLNEIAESAGIYIPNKDQKDSVWLGTLHNACHDSDVFNFCVGVKGKHWVKIIHLKAHGLQHKLQYIGILYFIRTSFIRQENPKLLSLNETSPTSHHLSNRLQIS